MATPRRRVLTGDVSDLVETSKPLHEKYRPQAFAKVLGQDHVVKSLQAALAAKARPHAFLFTGPAGTGKTTLSRILAAEFGCGPANIIEVDAASNSGIDDMRGVTQALRYNGFGETPNKAIIVDECHGLSKQAWDSLLKSVEEPPAHVFFFFCTTVDGKVPQTIVTRCLSYSLKPMRYDDTMDLLESVCEAERLETSDSILKLVARASEGSGRAALTMLAKVAECRDADEAAILLESPLDNPEIIELCRDLVKGSATWPRVQAVLSGLEQPAESARIVIVNYLNACLLGAKSDRDVVRLLDILRCFSKPCLASDKMAPLLLAFGDWVFE